MKPLIAAFLLLSTPVMADVVLPDGSVRDCYCTDKAGARVEIGQTVCLQVDGRMFMAQCQMSLNVPMWREVQEGCLSSSLQDSNPTVDAGPIDAQI
jgi:hypothetical protein